VAPAAETRGLACARRLACDGDGSCCAIEVNMVSWDRALQCCSVAL
jgi:hypothetical protein